MNGLLLELGFLQRLREDRLWERFGWIYGTSAGALGGRDGGPRPARGGRGVRARAPPRRELPRTPSLAAPADRAARLRAPRDDRERRTVEELARDVASAPVELVVCVTDVSDGETDEGDAFERVYSSRTATSEVMASAVLASAAISALVLPLRVGDVIGTDGSPGSPPHDRARRPGDLALDPTFRAGLEWPLGRSGARRARAGADGGGVARTGQEQGVRLKSDTCEVREVSES